MRIIPPLVFAASLVFAHAALAQKVYRWVDENGVVHYGDRMPVDRAGQDHHVLNKQGVTIEEVERDLTPEERAALAKAAEQEALQRERDRALLGTYLSVEEIEMLRDRRIQLIDTQSRVTRRYLITLEEQLGKLQVEAEKFRPADAGEDDDRPPMPEGLAEDIATTRATIAEYQQDLLRAATEKERVRAKFGADIQRFRELKAKESGQARRAGVKPSG